MKKVLILAGSPRIKGNSDILCDEFMRGAKESKNEVIKINVASKKVAPCLGCYYCTEHNGECVIKDDMKDILNSIIDCDVIVLASPVYFYSISAQLKAIIDRTVAKWTEVKDKEFYFIATCADDEKQSVETTFACFQGYVDCVEGAIVKGKVYGIGAYKKGEISNKETIQEAYKMGLNV